MFGLNLLRPLGARGFSSTAVAEKLKTHKGTAKRFSVTGTGIVSSPSVLRDLVSRSFTTPCERG